ncbi:ExeM/NucH family extracellular endonuclease [Corynebacterium gottingense]|uniref:ExeM/NucH family extracellular endonuclease n=1 Tax=Corynebacterium gottingense TaxID=2041036 RepID=UPI00142E0D1A|nr:ExeM/NucH family extracellular endonuclease [Corynebacterium gottingense]WJZ13870.1 Collagen triple helix repeat (20 copies) [Corynebacterium gottingense]
MRFNHRHGFSAAFIVALAAGTITVPTAHAATDGSNVVINEVYGGGGNSGSTISNDFVELYNPTDKDIDITGWVLDQQSAEGNTGNTTTLSGSVPAGGYFLIKGAAGKDTSNPLENADYESSFNFSGTKASAVLTDASGTQIDLVGWGGAANFEGKAAEGTSNSTSIQRKEAGVDTDDNAADFHAAAPTPQGSGSDPVVPSEPTDPADPSDPAQPAPEPGAITPIAEIQGTGAASPLEGKTVTTEGVVTAVYDEGGKNGFFLQTAGTGGAEKKAGDASDGIFVYMGGNNDFPQRGDSLQVTGKVSEYFNQTQITVSSKQKLDEALEAPKAVELTELPAGDDAREPYEGMLVRPGTYTVTDNYNLNNTGDLGLVAGTEPIYNFTDKNAPSVDGYRKYEADAADQLVYLDDGRTKNYFRSDKETPLPYLVTSDKGVKSIRTTDQVEFQTDVVVDYSFDRWRFQPLQPITGKNAADELPITWEDSRAKSIDVPGTVKGDFSLGFFNVLNYFNSLGQDEANCKAYPDMNGTPVGSNRCKVRGAYTEDAFKDQQAKIVTAINTLDVDVLGLSEIENSATVTGDVAKRDETLQNLVDALNDAAGEEKWALVKSPTQLGTDEDYIRVAFIYQKDKVRPVGESKIFNDDAFTGTARQPLAQEFEPAEGGDNFVAVVNHFKSKGSVANSDKDSGDGQGNNPAVREAQAQALIDHLNKEDEWADLPTFILGDLNSYTKEDAITTIEKGGFSLVHHEKDFNQASYQFGGRLGTLDHVLANASARDLVQDSAVWNINGDESVAFEYSRRNYNAQDFFGSGDDKLYGYGNPFRSSDHDPVKVGFNITVDPELEGRTIIKAEVLDDGHLWVTYSDDKDNPVDLGKVTGEDGAAGKDGQDGKDGKPGATGADGKDGDKGDKGDKGETGEPGAAGKDGQDGAKGEKGDKGDKGETGEPGAAGKDGKDGAKGAKGDKGDTGEPGAAGKDGNDGRGIESVAINEDGELIVHYNDGHAENAGKVNGTSGEDGKDGTDGTDGKDGAAGKDGKDGAAGRGVAGFEVVDGELEVTYTDGTTQKVGPIAGQDGATGDNGKDGTDGKDGKDGAAGRGVEKVEVDDEGNLVVTFTDGTTQKAGKVQPDAPEQPQKPVQDGGDQGTSADGSSTFGTILGIIAALIAGLGLAGAAAYHFMPQQVNDLLNQLGLR